MEGKKKAKMLTGKPVMEYEVVKIDGHVYNTLLSFVSASQNPRAPWNIGERFADFVQFKKPGRWVLKCYERDEEVICDLINRNGVDVDARFVMRRDGVNVYIRGMPRVFSIDDSVAFTADVPNAKHIAMADLRHKLSSYVKCIDYGMGYKCL